MTAERRLTRFAGVGRQGTLLSRKTPREAGRWWVVLGLVAIGLVFFGGQGDAGPGKSGQAISGISIQRPTVFTSIEGHTLFDTGGQAASGTRADESSFQVDSLGQVESQAPESPGDTETPHPGPLPQGEREIAPAERYGLWVILPAAVAIVLAIVTRQVLIALPLGILTGAVMVCALQGIRNPFEVVAFSLQHYLFGVLYPLNPANPDDLDQAYKHLQTLVFTLFIGGMIGLIEANGGTRAMVARVTHLMKTRRGGQVGSFGAGLLVFFDDYANCLIIGPAMRPVFDKLRISREKLAYIVDSTAAPVASLFIGTWLAAEINFLDTALATVREATPAFLAGMDGASAFWGSIPYRTYPILAIFMVFVIAVSGRDFGSMRKAEARAAGGGWEAAGRAEETAADTRHWLLGLLPVLMLIVLTLGLLIKTGYAACRAEGLALDFGSWSGFKVAIRNVFGQADTYQALLYAGLSCLVIALVTTLASRALSLARSTEAITQGMCRIFGAQIILILAWGLSSATTDLQLGQVARDYLWDLERRQLFSAEFLPLAIFLTAAVVSFSTGTSWGTMGILCPTTVAVAAHLLGSLPAEQALPLFYASVGAVLGGAVFGDHCSPISDTTVLSAMASDCPLEAHVRTQLPYALVTAVVGLVCTSLLGYGLARWKPQLHADYWNVYAGTLLAAVLLGCIVFLVGRRPVAVWRPEGT